MVEKRGTFGMIGDEWVTILGKKQRIEGSARKTEMRRRRRVQEESSDVGVVERVDVEEEGDDNETLVVMMAKSSSVWIVEPSSEAAVVPTTPAHTVQEEDEEEEDTPLLRAWGKRPMEMRPLTLSAHALVVPPPPLPSTRIPAVQYGRYRRAAFLVMTHAPI